MIKHCINNILGWLQIKRRMFIVPKRKTESHIPVSYAITVCNEAQQLKELLDFLKPFMCPEDEIVVQADKANVTDDVKHVISKYSSLITTYVEYELDFDFAKAKNHLNEQCKGQYIFQLDADEYPNTYLMDNLQSILRANAGIELFKIPRLNLFINRDCEEIERYVAWPDFQGRLYINQPQRIQWYRPLHEKINGHRSYVYLPKKDQYTIVHVKTKERDNAKWQKWKEHYA